jgi:TonB family protein
MYSSRAFCQDTLEFKTFFTKDDEETDEAHAHYYSTGKRVGGKGIYIDTVYSYYVPSNVVKAVKVYNEKGVLNGKVSFFHENGKLKQEGFYDAGRRTGTQTNWYADGKSHRTFQFSNDPDSDNFNNRYRFKILDYWDSTGVQLIKDGVGFCECYLTDYEKESGRVNDGFKDSLWSGSRNDTVIFKESYKKGQLINGNSYYKGKTFSYDKIEVPAEFPGGMDGLFSFLRKNIRFPSEARRMGVNGKVFVQFVVEKDGSLSDIVIVKGVTKSVDDESLRLVGMMKKWKPALQRGRPVKSKFVLPLTFRLEH